MKDQITQDIAVGAAKAAPPAVVTAATYSQGLTLSEWAMVATIGYTLVLTATTIVRHWGDWTNWITARASDFRRLQAWMRRRG